LADRNKSKRQRKNTEALAHAMFSWSKPPVQWKSIHQLPSPWRGIQLVAREFEQTELEL
jgi:hypothetical protein